MEAKDETVSVEAIDALPATVNPLRVALLLVSVETAMVLAPR